MSIVLKGVATIGVITFSLLTSYAQNARAPSQTPNVQRARPDPGQFWRDATVALGQVVPIGSSSRFVVTGTAVIVALDSNRGCLLTARHMLVDPATGQVTRLLWMRLTSDKGEEEQPIPLTLIDKNGHNVWIAQPNNDLAVIPIPFAQLSGKNLSAVSVADFISNPDDIFPGAQVLILGFPQVFRNPDQTNPYSTTPIARTGIVAWVDPADPIGKPFLVDANLYGGNSGGPVFRIKNGFDKYGNFSITGPSLEFIGIVSKGPTTTAPVIPARGSVKQPDPATGISGGEVAIVPYVGGIGVIEPASKARELLKEVFANSPRSPQ